MRAIRRVRAALAAAAVCSVLLLVAGPAGAVVGGQSDTSNMYANVGMLQGQFAPGEWFAFFTGTLIEADVVLTAAHCVDFLQEVGDDGLGPADLRISFDPEPTTYHYVDHIVTHPTGSRRRRAAATRSISVLPRRPRTSPSSGSAAT